MLYGLLTDSAFSLFCYFPGAASSWFQTSGGEPHQADFRTRDQGSQRSSAESQRARQTDPGKLLIVIITITFIIQGHSI